MDFYQSSNLVRYGFLPIIKSGIHSTYARLLNSSTKMELLYPKTTPWEHHNKFSSEWVHIDGSYGFLSSQNNESPTKLEMLFQTSQLTIQETVHLVVVPFVRFKGEEKRAFRHSKK